MKIQSVFEFASLEKFIVEMTTQNTLNISDYRNRIPWDNLPDIGLYRILAGDNEDLDDALVLITQPDEIFIIKNWLDKGGEWADDWFSGEMQNNFKTFLEDNDAFNIIQMKVLDPKKSPSWDNIKMENER